MKHHYFISICLCCITDIHYHVKYCDVFVTTLSGGSKEMEKMKHCVINSLN